MQQGYPFQTGPNSTPMATNPYGHPEAQGLLNQGRGVNGNQALVGLASSGVKVEDALGKVGISWQVMFFVCGVGIVFGAVIGALGALGTLEIASFIDELFLGFFGCLVLALCIPGNPRWTLKYRKWIRKYIRLLTRISGISIWCLFLGCMTACSLWPTSNDISTEDLLLFIAIVISFTVVAASIIGFMISIAKSMRLRDVQRYIQQLSKGQYADIFNKYAVASPNIGMRMDEFNRLCMDYTQGRIQYPLSDLNTIYNALEDDSKDALTEREFQEWMHGGICLL